MARWLMPLRLSLMMRSSLDSVAQRMTMNGRSSRTAAHARRQVMLMVLGCEWCDRAPLAWCPGFDAITITHRGSGVNRSQSPRSAQTGAITVGLWRHLIQSSPTASRLAGAGHAPVTWWPSAAAASTTTSHSHAVLELVARTPLWGH